MSTSPVINALKNKRAELSGELLVTQARMDNLRADLVSIDRALVLFDPDARPSAIVPIVRRPRYETRFRHGTWTASILSILRNAEKPLSVRELALMIAEEFNLPFGKTADVNRTISRVRAALKRKRLGLAEEYDGRVTTWRIAD